jgi:hypothetical protein
MNRSARLIFAAVAFVLGVAVSFAPHLLDFQLFAYLGRHPAAAYDIEAVHRADFARLGEVFPPGKYLPFGYPPTFLMFLPIAALLPVVWAKALWCGGWCSAFIYTASKDARGATPLLVLSLPMLWCLAFGATGLMITTMTIAGFQLRESRPRLAGVLLGLAACFKPQALLLAPIVLWGQWAVVRAAVVTGVCAVLASLLLGPHLWAEWVTSLPRFQAMIGPLFFKVSPAYLVDSVLWRVAIAGVGVWFAWRERNVAGLLVGNLLCTPYVQFYDLAGLSYLGGRLVAKGRQASAVEMVLGLALVVCVAWPPLTTLYCAGLIGLSLSRSRRRIERPTSPHAQRYSLTHSPTMNGGRRTVYTLAVFPNDHDAASPISSGPSNTSTGRYGSSAAASESHSGRTRH